MTTELEADLARLAAVLRRSAVAVRSGHDAGSGSGVVWTSDGTIVTNAHVARTPIVEVEFADGRRVRGQVDRRDAARDLARIRVDAGELSAAQTRDPHELRVGEFVAAFGNPLGLRDVLCTGIVHAAHRAGSGRLLQADVKIAPGNSGGALADAQGRVVGINSMLVGDLALAIPADDVNRFVGADRPAARLGVLLAPVQFADRRSAWAVIGVEAGSCAERSGIVVGDILATNDPAVLSRGPALGVLRGGKAVVVALVRDRNESNAAA